MAIAQCPTCNTVITGEPQEIATCPTCQTRFMLLVGTAKRRCDCGEKLRFSHMHGGLFNFQCPSCNFQQDFF